MPDPSFSQIQIWNLLLRFSPPAPFLPFSDGSCRHRSTVSRHHHSCDVAVNCHSRLIPLSTLRLLFYPVTDPPPSDRIRRPHCRSPPSPLTSPSLSPSLTLFLSPKSPVSSPFGGSAAAVLGFTLLSNAATDFPFLSPFFLICRLLTPPSAPLVPPDCRRTASPLGYSPDLIIFSFAVSPPPLLLSISVIIDILSRSNSPPPPNTSRSTQPPSSVVAHPAARFIIPAVDFTAASLLLFQLHRRQQLLRHRFLFSLFDLLLSLRRHSFSVLFVSLSPDSISALILHRWKPTAVVRRRLPSATGPHASLPLSPIPLGLAHIQFGPNTKIQPQSRPKTPQPPYLFHPSVTDLSQKKNTKTKENF